MYDYLHNSLLNLNLLLGRVWERSINSATIHCSSLKYCPRGSVFTAFCCLWLSCHSRGIVRVCGDFFFFFCCNLHSFLIKQWSVHSMKLASKEVTSRADDILWLKRSPWHNVLIHTYPLISLQSSSSVTHFLFYLFSFFLVKSTSQSPLYIYSIFTLYLSFINYASLMKDAAFILKGMCPLLMSMCKHFPASLLCSSLEHRYSSLHSWAYKERWQQWAKIHVSYINSQDSLKNSLLLCRWSSRKN